MSDGEVQNTVFDLWFGGDEARVLDMLRTDPGVGQLPDSIGDPIIQELLCNACEQGQQGYITELVDLGADVGYRSGEGVTPLLAACQVGLSDVVKLLLELGADPNDPKYLTPWPIHSAASSGDKPTIDALLAAGADANQNDLDGYRPLYVAAQWARPQSVLCLLNNGADPNVINDGGQAALHAAILSGCLDSVRLLHESGADTKTKITVGYFDPDPLQDRLNTARNPDSFEYIAHEGLDAISTANLMLEDPRSRMVVFWDDRIGAESRGGQYEEGAKRSPVRGGQYQEVVQYLKAIVP